jgi:hypothetical protein
LNAEGKEEKPKLPEWQHSLLTFLYVSYGIEGVVFPVNTIQL